MENTALNGTTNATKDHEDWKKKKGYGPILVVAVSLALLLSLYAGDYLRSGTTLPSSPLHRDEKGMTNAVASSSSTSLVGSGTAQGGSSAHCKKNTGYNCGAVFPPDGNTCGQKGCCCNLEDGTGYKLNSCDSAKGYAYRGCNSCWGQDACFQTSNINVGTKSCHGEHTCSSVSDSTIGDDSCYGRNACYEMTDSTIGKQCCLGEVACKNMQSSTIHDGSCLGGFSCFEMENTIIGKGSCNYSNGEQRSETCRHAVNTKIGHNSCNGSGVCKEMLHTTIGNLSCNGHSGSCEYTVYKKIGNNSCNGENVCYQCKHDVPDNACNQGITDDMDSNGFCNYCK